MVVKRICLTFFSIVYKDKNTPSPFIDQAPNDDGSLAKYGKPDHIYLDCMQAGMGCACLQVWERVFFIHYEYEYRYGNEPIVAWYRYEYRYGSESLNIMVYV